MKKLILLITLIAILYSCKEEPTSSSNNFGIVVLDKSCTEVWIDVKANDQANKLGSVYLNDEFRTQFYLKDTLIYLDNLLSNKSYRIVLSDQDGKTSQTGFTTMDTTSHNFIWETFEFGGVNGSSDLRDVAIINENDIWAVGEIFTEDTYTYDSNGVFQQPYNAVHWDGNKWELKRIVFQYEGTGYVSPIGAIMVFNENDIWFGIGSVIHFDGTDYRSIKIPEEIFPSTINGMWGTSSNDFYIIGNSGNIAHYNGSSWSKIESPIGTSGTDVDLKDIWGSPDGNALWACGNDDFKPTVLLKIENNQADLIYSSRDNLFSYDFNRLSGNFRSVWTDSKDFLYILTSYDLYRTKNEDLTNPTALWRDTENQIATLRVRGLGSNDIFTAGYEGLLCHYNGVSWRTYTELYERFKTYRGLSVKDNIVVAVGQDYINGIEDKAIITVTKR